MSGQIHADETTNDAMPSAVTSTEGGGKRALDVNVLNPGGGTDDVNLAEVGGIAAVQQLESGTDAVGADTYATILTPSGLFRHLKVHNEGTNPATISLDGGVTDNIVRFGGQQVFAYDDVSITTDAIQAKNASAGNNYTNLTIEVW